jgi:hypothetical protein
MMNGETGRKKDLKTHLVEMRKHLWRESHISWIGRWLGTGSGIRMLDA